MSAGDIINQIEAAKRDSYFIDQIEAARRGNNTNWMDLVRLAFEVAPDRARAIVRKINAKDGEISRLAAQLSEAV